MACNLLRRILRCGRRTRQEHDPTNGTFVAPALTRDLHRLPPIESVDLQHDREQLSDTSDTIIANERENLGFLGLLSDQGSCYLVVEDVPLVHQELFSRYLAILPGFTNYHWDYQSPPPPASSVTVTFSTSADAAMALAAHPQGMPVSDTERRPARALETTVIDLNDTTAPSRKRMRSETQASTASAPPKCTICYEEIRGPYVRPCFYCESPRCYDCLTKDFISALSDRERFPAKCCGRVYHYDVTKGILSAELHEKYKIRFEEFSTSKPVYCALKTCSTFLPTRKAKPNVRGVVSCPTCSNRTCSKCRELVDTDEHMCPTSVRQVDFVKKYGYKQCPRCNTAIARMYGCPHIRCQCGAHWCWECGRPIQICQAGPCESSPYQGEEEDDHDHESEFDHDEADIESEHGEDDSNAISVPNPPPETLQPSIQHLIGHITETPSLENLEQSILTQTSSSRAPPPEPRDRLDNSTASAHDVQAYEPGIEDVSKTGRTDLSSPPALDGSVTPDVGLEIVTSAMHHPPHDQSSIGVAEVSSGTLDPTTVLVPPPEPNDPHATTPLDTAEPLSDDINLDGSEADVWENRSLDFGDEPTHESDGTWGCFHHFSMVDPEKISSRFLPQPRYISYDNIAKQFVASQTVDCLRCYKPVAMTSFNSDQSRRTGMTMDRDLRDTSDPMKDTSSATIQMTTTFALLQDGEASRQLSELYVKSLRVRRRNPRSKLYNCSRCGVFYCAKCLKESKAEVKASMDNTKFLAP